MVYIPSTDRPMVNRATFTVCYHKGHPLAVVQTLSYLNDTLTSVRELYGEGPQSPFSFTLFGCTLDSKRFARSS